MGSNSQRFLDGPCNYTSDSEFFYDPGMLRLQSWSRANNYYVATATIQKKCVIS
jgi:hypothetical protein